MRRQQTGESSNGQESQGSTAVAVLQALRCLRRLAWSSPRLPKKGVPSSKGLGYISAGQCHPTSRLCQRELLQAFLPQPVPGEVLAGDHAHHLPAKGQGTDSRWPAEPGEKGSVSSPP